jgi:hypothetical protein
MLKTLPRFLERPLASASAFAASSRSALAEVACRNFASASGSGSAETARQTAAVVIKEIFGGQQSTLVRSPKKILNTPNIGVQVNSW